MTGNLWLQLNITGPAQGEYDASSSIIPISINNGNYDPSPLLSSIAFSSSGALIGYDFGGFRDAIFLDM
jgi:hypothetical protein